MSKQNKNNCPSSHNPCYNGPCSKDDQGPCNNKEQNYQNKAKSKQSKPCSKDNCPGNY